MAKKAKNVASDLSDLPNPFKGNADPQALANDAKNKVHIRTLLKKHLLKPASLLLRLCACCTPQSNPGKLSRTYSTPLRCRPAICVALSRSKREL